jgi:dTDP-4-amino-4,6-dideoxygalactose transaminase
MLKMKLKLKPYRSMGRAEAHAVAEVMRSGIISGFYGSPGEQYSGGPKVQEFERAWAKRFKISHVISVNSATSGLMAALGAVGISPGDEVIVPPLTMSATVVAPLIYGGIPVFADVEEDMACLSVPAVKAALTAKTKAIMAVNLFGHPARLQELRQLADERGIFLIEDNAQGPLAEEHGKLAGTIGHIGVFSLNYHKHIHTGEGGMCVTTDPDLARRLQLIRNHGENVVDAYKIKDITNLVGFNWRLTELQAAIGLGQLKAIDKKVKQRIHAAERLSRQLTDIPGLIVPRVRDECRAVYYVWAARIEAKKISVNRQKISAALSSAGVPHMAGYVAPLYMLPLFQQRQAIGRDGWPFSLSKVIYKKGMCPVAERLTYEELLGIEMCAYDFTDKAIDHVAARNKKVFEKYAQ